APFNRFAGAVESHHLVQDGDLLVSWSATLDAFIWNRGRAVLNQHIFNVRENPELIDRTYLFLALRSAMREIRLQVHGATMKHITKPEFEATRISLPSLPEQRDIARTVAVQLSTIQRARKAAEEQLGAAEGLVSSALSFFFAEMLLADPRTC